MDMYIIGLIKTDKERVLINPQPCANASELFDWIADFFNEQDFSMNVPVTLESIQEALKAERPIRINIEGYRVAVLFGAAPVIQAATDSFIHI